MVDKNRVKSALMELPSFSILRVWSLLTLMVINFSGDLVHACSVLSCNNDFVTHTKNMVEGPYFPYCTQLENYMKCVDRQARECHGNLLFHGTKISVETLLVNNNCRDILKEPPEHNTPPPLDTNLSSDGSDYNSDHYSDSLNPCQYVGSPQPAHCGLFGDPHLKTFNGTFLTCRVRGAWPLVSSTHLSIQVTNEPVGPDFTATATTKVTVVIKGNEECGRAKTYEASTEQLPKAFVDGTTFSGIDPMVPYAEVTEALPGHHIVIRVRKINATVTIRKVGKHLIVSATLPLEVVSELREEGELQLCEQGCPESEQLISGRVSVPAVPAMSKEEAMSLCAEFNVTDYYLDSCVFDLVTTGDSTFRDAAYLALKDMWQSDPKASYTILKNCTEWPCMWRITSGSHTSPSGTSYIIFAFSTIVLLLLDQFR